MHPTWTLLDAVEQNARHPRSFFIPPPQVREGLTVGDLVKLVFLTGDEDGGERMWVTVTERTADGTYVGRLDNEPIVVTELQVGARIEFGPRHVIAVHDERPHPYEQLVAVASERLFDDDDPGVGVACFEPEEVGREAAYGRRASGWSFLAGDETDEELADSRRIRLPSLPWLLERHPELWPVVDGHDGSAAVYLRRGEEYVREVP